jgi:hypothetical protein
MDRRMNIMIYFDMFDALNKVTEEFGDGEISAVSIDGLVRIGIAVVINGERYGYSFTVSEAEYKFSRDSIVVKEQFNYALEMLKVEKWEKQNEEEHLRMKQKGLQNK